MDTTTSEETVDGKSDRVRPAIEQAKGHLDRLTDRMARFIQDHPAACLVGALAIGYLVARVARRRS